MARHTRQALKLRADLTQQLEAVGKATGQNLVWTPEERAVLEQIMAAVDRKIALESRLAEANDAKAYVKVSGELRLTETHIVRLLKSVRVEMAKATSTRTVKARAAANARWNRTG